MAYEFVTVEREGPITVVTLNRPEVMIPQAQNKFDAEGKLNDQASREFISAHLAAFKAWVLQLK